MQIKSTTTIDTKGYYDGTNLKSHNTELGNWYGDETCHLLDINGQIEETGLVKGEYAITVIFTLITPEI